jgi:hypothetical protein
MSVGQVDAPPGASAASLPPEGPVPVAQPLALVGFEYSLDTASLDSLESVTRTMTSDRIEEGFSGSHLTEEVGLFFTWRSPVGARSSPGSRNGGNVARDASSSATW